MKRIVILSGMVAAAFVGAALEGIGKSDEQRSKKMQLGAFSISLAVKDIAKSKEFYEKLGFEAIGGELSQNWQIMRSGDTVVGLFQGMFEKNILTFNPGWDQQAENVDEFADVRDIQAALKERGVELTTEADASTSGPASFTLLDPDGNPILFDQHR